MWISYLIYLLVLGALWNFMHYNSQHSIYRNIVVHNGIAILTINTMAVVKFKDCLWYFSSYFDLVMVKHNKISCVDLWVLLYMSTTVLYMVVDLNVEYFILMWRRVLQVYLEFVCTCSFFYHWSCRNLTVLLMVTVLNVDYIGTTILFQCVDANCKLFWNLFEDALCLFLF